MTVQIHIGNSLDTLRDMPDESVHCVITSPPYWGLRAYNGEDGMIGLEETFEEHLENLMAVFREVRRVLRNDGVCVVNYGDAYSGSSGKHYWTKPKDLMMMPSLVAMAMQIDGWYLRSMIPWIKPNPMPESVTDRPTSAVEYFFLFSKSERYFWDHVAVRSPAKQSTIERLSQPNFDNQQGGPKDTNDGNRSHRKVLRNLKQRGHGRRHDGFNKRWDAMSKDKQQENGANMRNYIIAPTSGFNEAHFATFPPQVIAPFIKAGTSAEGVCPECGAPWERNAETQFIPQGDVSPQKVVRGAVEQKKYGEENNRDGTKRGSNEITTIGWWPSCECAAGDPVPATVMDPFAGAGTTGLVAQDMGRDAILLEISPEYAEMAHQRIGGIFARIVK